MCAMTKIKEEEALNVKGRKLGTWEGLACGKQNGML